MREGHDIFGNGWRFFFSFLTWRILFCVVADPWWNAAVEDQCINRIHRIGQTAKRIYVRKFYVENSIEERIMELQRRKKTVASSALCDRGEVGVDAASSNRPSLDDFKLLFRHDRADGSQFEGEKPPAKGDWVAS